MDLSSLPEAQQQQLQQLHQQFQQHQQEQQHQQQQQELASQAYDPSHAQAYSQSTQAYDQSTQAYEHSTQVYDQSTQAYDQSTQPYYPYHQYPQHHQQHYPYYQPDYANAYQPQSHPQLQSQPSQNDVQPPGISVQHEASSQVLPGQGQGQGQYHHQQHNAYHPQGVAEQQQNSSSSYPVPSGLNPAAAAAVAALSQLTQFAGNMDAAERAMAGLQERQWQAKSGGYGPMPPHMYPQGGFHHEPYPVRGWF